MHVGRNVVAITLIVLSGLLASPALGVPAAFTINSGSSSLAISGNVAGNNISQQTAGSLVTSYSGTINTDLVGSTIEFLSASADAAQQAQNQQPDIDGLPGSDPADYGFQVSTIFGSATGAVRSLLLNIASSPINIVGGSFTSDQTFSVLDGAVDYNAGIAFGRRELLDEFALNSAAPAGSIQTVALTETLTVPVNFTYTTSILTADDTQLNLIGTLIATRLIPEPATLSSVAVGSLLLMRRRK